MRIDHAQLRALAAVIREGSFERAALSLNVTASAVSQRIKSLEDRVGKPLIKRTIPTEATPEGQVLVQLAEQTALLERDAFERIRLQLTTSSPLFRHALRLSLALTAALASGACAMSQRPAKRCSKSVARWPLCVT